jgi:hypothetical protein
MNAARLPDSGSDTRSAMELAQTARSRFEATAKVADDFQLDLDRIKACGEEILENVHRGSGQESPLWVVEAAQAMLTAVMAVNREPLPVSRQVDAASFAISVLRDLATAARQRGLDWSLVEKAAASSLKTAEKNGFSNQEVYWGLNRATASLELAWARNLAEEGE